MKVCTLTVLLKSVLSRFTSPAKIVFAWNIVLSSQCQILIKKLSEIEVAKQDVKFFLTFHMIFKIFFQNYSLSIINAHPSLAKRLRVRQRGLGESSGFSYPLGRGKGGRLGGLVGMGQLLTYEISKFVTLYYLN